MIQSDVDVVLLAEPPHFRPIHLKAAIEAGKHVFAEKPVAVDAPGVRSVLASAEEAKKKNLNLVAGLCWRYDYGVRETMKRILDGAIGEIKSHPGNLPDRHALAPRRGSPTGPKWMYQLRNWYYFTWLSGDFNTEQHVHSLDKAAWAMHDQPPVRAWGLGGRQVRTEPKYGDIFDHHAVVYEYANGVHVHSLLPPDRRLLQRRLRHLRRHQGPGQHPAEQDQGRESLALHRSQAQHVRRGAPGVVRRHPLGQDDQQRRLSGPEHDAGASSAGWSTTPARR